MEQSKMKKGFTLAEVLITLAVIGIVAAMTIPNLVQSYNKKVVETKLVKFYGMMNNAIRLAEVDYGPQSTWTDYYITEERDKDNNEIFDKGDKYDVLVRKYFAPYLKITGSEEFSDTDNAESIYNSDPQKIYYLADGSAFGFYLHENREIFFYPKDPKNCLKNSYQRGSCLFVFAFIPAPIYDEYSSGFKYNISNGMQPDLYKWDGNEDSLMTDNSGGCEHGGTYCTEVIRRNGWKIPEDYPYKC